jgi:hypothetical protein
MHSAVAQEKRQLAIYDARRPPIPDECRARPGDEEALGVKPFTMGNEFFIGTYAVDWEITKLRELEPTRAAYRFIGDVNHPPFTVENAPVPNDLARAKEIVDAYDRWAEIDGALSDELGLDREDELSNEAINLVHELENKITKTPANTLQGLAVKAYIALAYNSNVEPDKAMNDPREDRHTGDTENVLYYLAYDLLKVTGVS